MSTTLNAESFSEVNIRKRTSLNQGVSAGSSTIPVASTQSLTSGQPIFVGTPARDGCEAAVVDSVTGATTIALTAPLTLDHSAYEPVISVIGGSINIDRAATVDGTVPYDGSFSLLVTRTIDPDQQTTYYTDPDGGSDYWYTLTYFDATSNAETAPEDAVAVRGSDSAGAQGASHNPGRVAVSTDTAPPPTLPTVPTPDPGEVAQRAQFGSLRPVTFGIRPIQGSPTVAPRKATQRTPRHLADETAGCLVTDLVTGPSRRCTRNGNKWRPIRLAVSIYSEPLAR